MYDNFKNVYFPARIFTSVAVIIQNTSISMKESTYITISLTVILLLAVYYGNKWLLWKKWYDALLEDNSELEKAFKELMDAMVTIIFGLLALYVPFWVSNPKIILK